MVSASSSLANTGSFIHSASTSAVTLPDIAVPKKNFLDQNISAGQLVQFTKFVGNFSIGLVNLSLTQLGPSNEDQKIFHFTVGQLAQHVRIRTFDIEGDFTIGSVSCQHLLVKTPDNLPVEIIRTTQSESSNGKSALLALKYVEAKRESPEFATVHNSVCRRVEASLSR